MSLQNIPDILKTYANFVVWKFEKRNGERTKPPFDANQNSKHAYAKTNDPSTWATFERAAAVANILSGNDYEGSGFVFTGTDYVGADLDGVVHDDGTLDPFAIEIAKLANSYCEFSPSGTGVHIIFESSLPLPKGNRQGNKKLGGEIYNKTSPRYFTLTGNKVEGLSSDDIAKIEDPNKIELLHFMVLHLHDTKLTKLWMGDASAYENDDSRLDLALLGFFAREFNGDVDKMTRFFNASVPGRREKWQREDYRKLTINKALKGKAQNPQVESGKSWPRENVGDYVHAGERRNGKEMHPLLAKAREKSLQYDKEQLVFNPTETRKAVTPIIDGFLAEGDSVLFVGAKKSEKSLFSLRLSMHIACGKNWYGHKNTRPRKVAYLDAENGGPTIGARYDAVIQEFSVEEQRLIHANFQIIDGQKWIDIGGSLDALDDQFWEWYAKKTADAEVHVLDCLYRFHNLDPKDSNGMLDVLTVLRMRLQNEVKNRTVIILNHTRSFSNDDLKKSSSISLERLGSIGFSEQSFGTKSLLKYMTVIGCLDKQFKRDEDNVITDEQVHFQFYGREISSGESGLMKFEPIDEGYGRRLIRTLSKGAKSAAVELRMARGDNGAWSSKHAAAKDIKKSSRSSAYRQLDELLVKEYLVEDAEGTLQLQISPDLAREISIAEEKNDAFNAARKWLRGYVTHSMKAENVIDIGDEQGHNREDLIAARAAAGLIEYEQPGLDPTLVGTLMWRPKKRPGHKKGSDTAKKAAEKRWGKDDEQAELATTGIDTDV